MDVDMYTRSSPRESTSRQLKSTAAVTNGPNYFVTGRGKVSDEKNQLFWNKGKDTIHITYLRFQSDIRPREWDTNCTKMLLDGDEMHILPITGTGEIFVKWTADGDERADHFTVQFDDKGTPYPYIFGGDRWTMALRHAALRAIDGDD